VLTTTHAAMRDELPSDDVNWFRRHSTTQDARLDVALVHCLSCDGKAEVRMLREVDELRLTCFHCGHNQAAPLSAITRLRATL